jgi:hypothetical protein
MTWAYARQADHEADALALLLSQFEPSTLLRGLLAAGMAGVQGVEDEANRLITERTLDTAVGEQLDMVGWVVGEPRMGRSDGLYRAYIKARILVNRSSGEPDRMLRIVRMVLGREVPFQLAYLPVYPAGFRVDVSGAVLEYPWDNAITSAEVAQQLVAMLTEAAPAGVQVGVRYAASPSTNTFTLSGSDAIETSLLLGCANDAQTTGGHLSDVEQSP